MDYSEILCQAIDTIASTVVKKVTADITRQYTVVDDSLKSEGKYTVSDGSVKIVAYSESDEYKKDDNVYVFIPEGNYDNQKFIVGKKLKFNNYTFISKSPYDDFIDLESISSTEQVSLCSNGVEKSHEIISLTFNENEPIKKDYTRLGIKADFTSLLGGFQVFEGNYGLIVYLMLEDKVIETAIFDCQDMLGNIYNFLEPTTQEIVLDISHLSKIDNIKVYFYQSDNFKDKFFNRINSDDLKMDANLFVENVTISFGLDAKSIRKETIKLYTNDNIMYGKEDVKIERTVGLRWIHLTENKTPIVLRNYEEAVREGEIAEFLSQCEVRWYKYDNEAPAADEYSGVHWKRINEYIKLNNLFYQDKGIKYNKNTELYESNLNNLVNDEEIEIEDYIEVEGNFNNLYLKDTKIKYPPLFSHTFIPDKDTKTEEKFKVIIIKNQFVQEENGETVKPVEVYYSDDLVFYNKEEIINQATLDAISLGLSLVPEDKYEGKYYLYDMSNKLLDDSQKDIARTLRCYFADSNGAAVLSGHSKIKWTVPKELNSMMVFGTLTNLEKKETENSIIYSASGENIPNFLTYYIKSQYNFDLTDNTIYCEIIKNKISYKASYKFQFGNLGTNGTDYTLVLELDKSSILLPSSIPLKSNERELNTKNSVKITAKIYDAFGKEILYNNDTTFNFTKESSKDSNVGEIRIERNVCTIIPYNEININYIDIIRCEVSNIPSCNYRLVNYIGIPLGLPGLKGSGPDKIIYSSTGKASYSNRPYYLLNSLGKKIFYENLQWEIFFENREDEQIDWLNFLPKIKPKKESIQINSEDSVENDATYQVEYEEEGKRYLVVFKGEEENEENKLLFDIYKEKNYINFVKLIPAEEQVWELNVVDMIFDNCPKMAVRAYSIDNEVMTVYYQFPLIMLFNVWTSQIINEWDGNTLGINEENGSLIAKMLAAGHKNNYNEFSGVLIGDWKTETGNALSHTGLYGFHNGMLSFSFKEDGTATIGKKNVGQISFNGNKGTITSGIYELSGGKDGAFLDFVNGKIILSKNGNGSVILDASDATVYQTTILDADKGISKINGKDLAEHEGLIYQNNKWTKIEYQKDETTQKYTGEYKIIEDNGNYTPIYKSGFPIKAGENFKVAWDGSIFANNGFFTGTINATGGNIIGNLDVKGTLHGATIKSGKFFVDYNVTGGTEVTQRYPTEEELEAMKKEPPSCEEKVEQDSRYYKYLNLQFEPFESQEDFVIAINNKQVLIQYIYGFGMDIAENTYPIKFTAHITNNEIQATNNETAGIGLIKTSQGTIMLGIKTGLDEGNLGNIGIGLDSAQYFKATSKEGTFLAIGNSIDEPLAQISLTQTGGKGKVIICKSITGEKGEIIPIEDEVCISANKITFITEKADQQYGIYARFAPEE